MRYCSEDIITKELNLKNMTENVYDYNSSSKSNKSIFDDDDEVETARIEDLTFIRNYSLKDVFNKKRFKILTVDDNFFINQSVKSVIEAVLIDNNSDYEVICGSDGIDILQLIREDQNNGNLIKCIITDENMEYLNGSESIKLIRQFEKSGKTKPVNIISSTCHEDEDTTKNILVSGSQMKLSKPLNKFDLVKAFKHLNLI